MPIDAGSGGPSGRGDVTTLPDAIWTGAITAAIAVAVIALGFVLWRNRGRILGRRTPA